jgi:hypothetical protein
MNLLTLPFRLPLLPAEGVVRLAEVVMDEAERQWHDPALVQRQLEEAQEARQAGLISAEELARLEAEAVSRLVNWPPAARQKES